MRTRHKLKKPRKIEIEAGTTGIFALGKEELPRCELGRRFRLTSELPLGSLLVAMMELESKSFGVSAMRPGLEVTADERETARLLFHWGKLIGVSVTHINFVDSDSMKLIEKELP